MQDCGGSTVSSLDLAEMNGAISVSSEKTYQGLTFFCLYPSPPHLGHAAVNHGDIVFV